ncbi:MAG: hypothetical protein GY853_03305 [PVC group bacterium]|nr:hypothetical protein [PVC group bacterium]
MNRNSRIIVKLVIIMLIQMMMTGNTVWALSPHIQVQNAEMRNVFTDSAIDQALEYERKIHEELKQEFDKSRICNLPNRQRFLEDLVEDLDQGKKIQAVYLNIQNFKGEFNDFGDALDELAKWYKQDKMSVIGHEFGDFGIQAVAEYLTTSLRQMLGQTGNSNVTFKIYNDAKSFWVIFEDLPDWFDAKEILVKLLSDDFAFKSNVVKRIKQRMEERIQNKEQTGEVDLVKAKKLRNRMKEFNENNFNIYAGVSQLFTRQKNQSIIATAHTIDSQVLLAAKFAQFNLINHDLAAEQKKRVNDEEGLKQWLRGVVAECREARKSRVESFNLDLRKKVRLYKKYGQREELESIYTPIKQVYDDANTYKKLMQRYEAALETKDINLIKEVKKNAFWKMVVYPLGDFLDGIAARPIFSGNQRVADMINHIVLNQPDRNWSGTFKIGGDEFVKIVWEAGEDRLYSYIYSFDVNNLGRTNIQWGVRVGDMLLDTMVWLFDELENPDMEYIYKFFRNENKKVKNFRDLNVEITANDYAYLRVMMSENGRDIEDYTYTRDGKYYLEQIPPVRVEVEDEKTGEMTEYYSTPFAAIGMVHVDTKVVHRAKLSNAEPFNIYRNYGPVRGRADSASLRVKEFIKKYQLYNGGNVSPDALKKAKRRMEADALEEKAIITFKEEKMSLLQRELAEFIFAHYVELSDPSNSSRDQDANIITQDHLNGMEVSSELCEQAI